MSNKIIILTGAIQTGKTTLLQQFCREQKNVAGILTPVINSKRMFYHIVENGFFEMEATGEEEEKLAIGKYLFSEAAFIKANNILLDAGQDRNIKYLVIDEIGPLEIKQQKGLYQSLNTILQSSFDYTLIIVVREGLVEEVIAGFRLSRYNTEILKDLTKITKTSF